MINFEGLTGDSYYEIFDQSKFTAVVQTKTLVIDVKRNMKQYYPQEDGWSKNTH